jgi:hypothetical protein
VVLRIALFLVARHETPTFLTVIPAKAGMTVRKYVGYRNCPQHDNQNILRSIAQT